MKKIKYIVILAALVCGLFVAPNNGFTLDMQMSDLFLTPNTNDFLGGYLGGLEPWNIDWSIANARPFSAKADDMVFSTCIGDYSNSANWMERMRITNEGNIGIGTTTPGEKLEVNGNIQASGYKQGTGGETLRIVRGVVNASATTITGSGFTGQKLGTGQYQIDFTTSFVGMPTVTASPFSSFAAIAVISQVNSGFIKVNVFTTNGSAFNAGGICFIVIGTTL